MKCHMQFSRKNIKIFISVSSAESDHSVVSVKLIIGSKGIFGYIYPKTYLMGTHWTCLGGVISEIPTR